MVRCKIIPPLVVSVLVAFGAASWVVLRGYIVPRDAIILVDTKACPTGWKPYLPAGDKFIKVADDGGNRVGQTTQGLNAAFRIKTVVEFENIGTGTRVVDIGGDGNIHNQTAPSEPGHITLRACEID